MIKAAMILLCALFSSQHTTGKDLNKLPCKKIEGVALFNLRMDGRLIEGALFSRKVISVTKHCLYTLIIQISAILNIYELPPGIIAHPSKNCLHSLQSSKTWVYLNLRYHNTRVRKNLCAKLTRTCFF